MANREAVARIKINKFLEAAGWRFLAEGTRDYEHHDSMSPVRQLTVNNEMGVLFPVEQSAQICHSRGVSIVINRQLRIVPSLSARESVNLWVWDEASESGV